MKKLQLSIIIVSFLWIFHAIAGVFSLIPAYRSNNSDLECCLQGVSVSVKSDIADSVFLYPKFDPNFVLHPNIFCDVGPEDINLDTDIDATDSGEGFEMNDRDVSLTSPVIKEIPVLIVRSIALKIINFPPEISRLRI